MVGRTFRFSEHQFRSYDDLGLTSQDPVLEVIETINRAAGCEIFRLERKGLRAQDRVGLVRAGLMTFEILPKIDRQDGEPGRNVSAERNLLAMLSYAYAFPIQLEAEADLTAEPGGWFELLTRLFANHLHSQLLAGMAHHYVGLEDSLPVLRGRLDLARQMRQPVHNRHHFEVSYEELTADTPLNQVFRWVVEELANLSVDRANLLLLAGLRDWLQPVTFLPVISPVLLERITFDRNTERFHPAFTLAQLFLEGNILRLRSGDLPAYAFVFEMDRLFERFAAGFLKRHYKRILPPLWQDVQILTQSAGRQVFLAQCEGRGVLRLIPDLFLRSREGGRALLIADTKYRFLEGVRQDEMAREDVYQMLAYLVRLGCRRGLLLYPQPEGREPVRRKWSIDTPGLEIFSCTLSLHTRLDQPDALIAEFAEIAAMATGETLNPSL